MRKWLIGIVGGLVLAGAAVRGMRAQVRSIGSAYIVSEQEAVPQRFTAIVLGCRVDGDDVSACLEERLVRVLVLYQEGSVQRLLLSGDHGRKGHDEVNTMKAWLHARGVPFEHLFLDHAGFDTYDSMVRARDIFAVKDAIVVSQAFHLPRAVYLARSLGIDAVGAPVNPPGGSVCRGSAVREPIACAKAWMNVAFHASPTFKGPSIPITGPSAPSFDQPIEAIIPASVE